MQHAHTDTLTPSVVPQLLREYGRHTRAALNDYLPKGCPQPYLYDLLADYPARGGKMMRSTLCIATARAFGARLEDALPSAVAIELLHNAMLIHDDIQDGSTERRGQPTLHRMHGMPLALNAGDALCLAGMRPLIDNVRRLGPRIAQQILEDAERMAWESAEGQALELGWRRDNCDGLSDDDYLTMVLKKTCWLATILPSRIGALIGSRGTVDTEPLIRFGFFLGAAFQIQDDLLNLTADDRYGKELNGDLWEGKRTLMLNRTFRESSEHERRRLRDILASPRGERTAEQVIWIRDLMDRCQAVEHARGVAHGLAGAALYEYDRIYGRLPASRDREFIRGLITWVFERT